MLVVIPAYDAAWSIRDTLRSVQSQTHRALRVVVVDDGSPEDLRPVVGPLMEEDPRIALVRQPNAGLAAARNRGLAEADTPFVAFIDSDDLWHPDFLARLVAALEAEPGAPFAYAHSLRFDRDNRVLPLARWAFEPRHDLVGLLALNTVGSGSASVFRTEAIRAAGGFDPSLRERDAEGAEDWKLSLRLAARAPPVLVDDYLAAYRLVATSMSQSDPRRQLRAVRTVLADIAAEIPGLPARAMRDARTAANGWLLAAVWRHRLYLQALGLLAESYLLNPLWFLRRELRAIHGMKLRSLRLAREGQPPLESLEEADGRRPYAFLGQG